jgi:DNA replication and repair protein RecF
MAEWGSYLVEKRLEVTTHCAGYLIEIYREISGGAEKASMTYIMNVQGENSGKKGWKNVFYQLLNERRKKDIDYGFSSIGPHRDDLRFFLDNKPARTFGSQGQCRSLALSLKLSSIGCIERYRDDPMIFLIDDAASELDQYRSARIYPLIANRGQIFIAAPEWGSPVDSGFIRCSISKGTVSIV